MNAHRILPDLEVFSNIEAREFSSKYEAEIVLEMVRFLAKKKPDFYNEFSVFILLNNGVHVRNWDIENAGNNKKNVFIVFDEHGRVPLELIKQDSNIVFHAHLSFAENDRKYSNLFHYPLGCNSFVPASPYVSVGERKINVFFSGNLHSGRKRLYQNLAHLPGVPLPILVRIQSILKAKFDGKFPDSIIRFTEGFSKGLSFENYADHLSHSKILLSPPGISNHECFRHYEGLRAGCVVVTERVPVKPQYTGSPIIEVDNWSKGFKIINALLKDPDRLADLSKRSYFWYKNNLSPEPVAQYVLERVKAAK
jgi:hypothetical protein